MEGVKDGMEIIPMSRQGGESNNISLFAADYVSGVGRPYLLFVAECSRDGLSVEAYLFWEGDGSEELPPLQCEHPPRYSKELNAIDTAGISDFSIEAVQQETVEWADRSVRAAVADRYDARGYLRKPIYRGFRPISPEELLRPCMGNDRDLRAVFCGTTLASLRTFLDKILRVRGIQRETQVSE